MGTGIKAAIVPKRKLRSSVMGGLKGMYSGRGHYARSPPRKSG